jgi:hypothetical protein
MSYDPRYHNYKLKSLVVKEKDVTWAMVCYDSTKTKAMEKEFRRQLKRINK